jgi:hypothetical protein
MANLDITKDYYGDLGLSPGADVNDIKKQFKKLGKDQHRMLAHKHVSFASQLLNTTQTGIRAANLSSTPSSKQFRTRTKFLRILNRDKSTMPNDSEMDLGSAFLQDLMFPEEIHMQMQVHNFLHHLNPLHRQIDRRLPLLHLKVQVDMRNLAKRLTMQGQLLV